MSLTFDRPLSCIICICSSSVKFLIESTNPISFGFKSKFTDSLILYPLLLFLAVIFGSISNPLFSMYFIISSYLGLFPVIFLSIPANILAFACPFDK